MDSSEGTPEEKGCYYLCKISMCDRGEKPATIVPDAAIKTELVNDASVQLPLWFSLFRSPAPPRSPAV